MLIEIHILQNHAPANLNRDDSGSPKTATFGDFKRARISSQCLKRTVRRSDAFQAAMHGHLATRSRRLPHLIQKRFKDAGLGDYAETAAQKTSGFGTADGKERPFNPKTEEYETAQTILFTKADEDAVFETLQNAANKAGSVAKFKDLKAADLQKEARQSGFRPLAVDVALFGRMVTSEAFRDVEASTQVAHAISTNKVTPEFDYFTAVDDLMREDTSVEEDAGADMIGDVEYNSACYYKYFSIHPDALVDNLTGREFRGHISKSDRDEQIELAATAVAEFLRAAVMVSPTGKQNSFAAHQLPFAILVEVRPNALPISYANAFVLPVRPSGNTSLPHASFEKLKTHVEALTKKFGLKTDARWLLTEADGLQIDGVGTMENLDELCGLLRNQVLSLKNAEALTDA